MKSLKVYAKLVLAVAAVLVVGAVVWNNRKHEVDVWFFKTYESVNVVWLILCSAVAAVFFRWILAAVSGVWRDLRELHRVESLRKMQRDAAETAEKSAEAERRIDGKLKRAVEREEG